MKVLSVLLLSLTSLYATAESSPISEIPLFNCPAVKLSASGKQLAKENHDRFAKLCLVCDGDDCAMRAWPADYETYEDLCRNTFCAPIKSKRARLLDQSYLGDHTIRFHYRISSAGGAGIGGEHLFEGRARWKNGARGKKGLRQISEGLYSTE